MTLDNPNTIALNVAPVTEATLESTDEEEPEAHHSETNEKHRTTTPFVDIDNGRDSECDVKNVLHGL